MAKNINDLIMSVKRFYFHPGIPMKDIFEVIEWTSIDDILHRFPLLKSMKWSSTDFNYEPVSFITTESLFLRNDCHVAINPLIESLWNVETFTIAPTWKDLSLKYSELEYSI